MNSCDSFFLFFQRERKRDVHQCGLFSFSALATAYLFDVSVLFLFSPFSNLRLIKCDRLTVPETRIVLILFTCGCRLLQECTHGHAAVWKEPPLGLERPRAQRPQLAEVTPEKGLPAKTHLGFFLTLSRTSILTIFSLVSFYLFLLPDFIALFFQP